MQPVLRFKVSPALCPLVCPAACVELLRSRKGLPHGPLLGSLCTHSHLRCIQTGACSCSCSSSGSFSPGSPPFLVNSHFLCSGPGAAGAGASGALGRWAWRRWGRSGAPSACLRCRNPSRVPDPRPRGVVLIPTPRRLAQLSLCSQGIHLFSTLSQHFSSF